MKIDKKAILVISFGTSYFDTMEKTIEAIEKEIQYVYTDYMVYRAFTSKMIIDKLQKRNHIKIDTVEEAIEKIIQQCYTTVICQPTYIMNGIEYEKVKNRMKPYEKMIDIQYGLPLLSSSEDYRKVVRAIIKENTQLTKKDVLVLIGHGTEHFSDESYNILNDYFSKSGYGNILVGTVKGSLDIETILKKLQAINSNIVYLTPFMIVAGNHANHDIFSDKKDSWKTKIEENGYFVQVIFKGLGEYPSIRNIFIEHIQNTISNNIKYR